MQPLILDGAFGTFIAQHGFELRAPLWSARAIFDAPQQVIAIIGSYLDAGAQIIRLPTFGLHLDTVDHGLPSLQSGCQRARHLAELAFAQSGRTASLWGTVSARRDLPRSARKNHLAAMLQALLQSGIGEVCIETQTSADEVHDALVAVRSVATLGPSLTRVWLGLVGSNADQPPALLGGDSWTKLQTVLNEWQHDSSLPALGLALHCTPLSAYRGHLNALAPLVLAHAKVLLALYPHAGLGPPDQHVSPVEFGNGFSQMWSERVHDWPHLAPRLAVIGGCCQSTPMHIAELRRQRDAARFMHVAS